MIRVIVGQFLPVMEAAVSDTSDRFITFSPYDADQLTVLGTLYAGPESTGYVVLKGNFDDIDAASSLPLVRQWIEDLQDEVVDLHAIAGNYEDEEDDWLTDSEYDFSDEEEEDENNTGEWNLYAGVWSDGGITSLEFDESFHELGDEAQIAILTDIATAAVAGVKAIRDAQDAE
jgi:hypothetical protein